MENSKILVTAAAGSTGKTTTLTLLEKGFEVRAFVRKRDDRSKVLEDAGAEIFVGDMADLSDFRQALKNVNRAYLCMPTESHGLHKMMTFAVAAGEAKLEALVWMSQWTSSSEHPSIVTRDTYLADQILKWIPGINLITINPGWFADNYFYVMESMAQLGIMPLPLGNGHNAPPSNEDMGRVIAELLANPEPHRGKTYRPTGPKLLSPEQIANSVGKAVGRKVKYMDIPEKMFLKAMKSQGFGPLTQMDLLRYYTEDYRQDAFAIGAPTNVVQELTGRPPEDIDTIARRYVERLPEAKQSAVNKLKGIAAFVKIILTKSPNVEVLEREWEMPILKNRVFVTDNPRWRQNHDKANAYGVDKYLNKQNLKFARAS